MCGTCGFLRTIPALELRGKAGVCARVTAGPKRPHLGMCPGPNIPLQGRQGSRGCIPGSPVPGILQACGLVGTEAFLCPHPFPCLYGTPSSLRGLPRVLKSRLQQLLIREGRGCRYKGDPETRLKERRTCTHLDPYQQPYAWTTAIKFFTKPFQEGIHSFSDSNLPYEFPTG